jgi:hypothetical protein
MAVEFDKFAVDGGHPEATDCLISLFGDFVSNRISLGHDPHQKPMIETITSMRIRRQMREERLRR